MYLKNLNSSNIINFLFALFPLSFILGNFVINLNILLLLLFTCLFYKKEIFNFNLTFLDKLIIFFFIYTFFVLSINFFKSYLSGSDFPETIINKSFFFFRYLLFYLIIRILLTNNIIQLKNFFYSCLFLTIFVSLDIFIQAILKYDLFGIQPISSRHFSGPFGEELIAGGYLQRFSIFGILPIFFFIKNELKRKIVSLIFLLIILLGIIFSGNRMPLVMYLLFLFAYFCFLFKDKKKIFLAIFFSIILIFISYNNLKFVKLNLSTFYFQVNNLINVFVLNGNKSKLITEDKKILLPYEWEFTCALNKMNKNFYFGGGIRSYRIDGGCNSHPHNTYLEILIDLGLFGLLILLYIFYQIIKKINLNKNYNIELKNIKKYSIFLLLAFLIEFFPIKSTGSFFSTNNATYIFLILSLLITMINSNLSKK